MEIHFLGIQGHGKDHKVKQQKKYYFSFYGDGLEILDEFPLRIWFSNPHGTCWFWARGILVWTIFTNLPFSSFFKGQYLGIYFSKKGKKLQAYYYSHREKVYRILSKSGGGGAVSIFFFLCVIWHGMTPCY